MNIDGKRRRQQRIKQLIPTQQSWQEWRVAPSRRQFLYKCLVSLVIYAFIWSVFQLEHSYALKMQQAVRDVMNDSFDYIALSSWYEEHIGTIPSILPAYQEHSDPQLETVFTSPVSVQPIESHMDQSGVVQFHMSLSQKVTTISRGLVQYVGSSSTKGITVRVLHAGGIQAIYGGLESVQVKKNDWLEEGVLIGQTSILYFALKKGDQYVNPEDVIPFD